MMGGKTCQNRLVFAKETYICGPHLPTNARRDLGWSGPSTLICSTAKYVKCELHRSTHCITLHHTAKHCNKPHHTATHCNTLQHTVTHCNTLQHTVTHCNTLQHTATHRTTLQHTASNEICKFQKLPTCAVLMHLRTHLQFVFCRALVTLRSAQLVTKDLLKWKNTCWKDLLLRDVREKTPINMCERLWGLHKCVKRDVCICQDICKRDLLLCNTYVRRHL